MGIIANFILRNRKQISNSLPSDDNNTVPGMQDQGYAARLRHVLTEFGSPWQGPKHPSFEEGLIGPGSISPPRKLPLAIEKGFVLHQAEDFASELPYYLLPEIEKEVSKFSVKSFLRNNWKVAAGGALLGLYLTKPLSLFSGRDDESNTLEGLRHGGLSQQMRRKMTPFGSGWDPMRALAREAGMTLEKFVQQPHMKLAMASGDVVRELGQGTFGKVHLMESSVRIGEKEHKFQYARKTIFSEDKIEAFHEVKTQRKLQDLNAPSVYGFSGNQVFMESFQGRSAGSFLREGGQLPESFISDLEKFLPEMHSRGISHMDMTRDVNRLLGKKGASGEIVPHNIILTREGRAGVIDYGSTMRSSGKTEAMHKIYNHTTYGSNAEMDMSLVKSLRQNNGKLAENTMEEFNQQSRSTPHVAPPTAKTMKAKARTLNQSIATKATAKDMMRIGSGRRSKSKFVSTGV